MLSKAALPVMAALSISLGVTVQQASASGPHIGTTDPFLQMQAQAKAHADKLRRAWLAAHKELPPITPPTITGGKVLTTSLDVSKPPAAPQIRVQFQTGNSGISEIDLNLQPAAGTGQTLRLSHYVANHSLPTVSGAWPIQEIGDSYGYGTFNPYSDHGKWALTSAYIYDQAGNYTYYDQSQLETAFGCPGSLSCISLSVLNAGNPDHTAPLITGGKILTPKVALDSAFPTFQARLLLSDNNSGAKTAYVQVCPPSGSTGSCVDYSNYAVAPFSTGAIIANDWICESTDGDCTKTATGTWTINYMGACDVARNCTYDYDTTDITNVFGTTTFVVKPHS